MPLVSIIIPVYNSDKYLRKCLDSIILQTYKNIEIIIINDGSSDNSKTILEEYQKNYTNIKVINNPTNLGTSIARNIGLDLANGDYIYFSDSDDFLAIDAIEKLVNLAKLYNVSLVTAQDISFFKEKDINLPQKKITNNLIDLNDNKDEIKSFKGAVWNTLYTHELVKGLTFPDGLNYEDNAFIYPILTKAQIIAKTNEVLYFYRRRKLTTSMQKIIKVNDKVLDRFDIALEIKKRCIELGTYDKYQKVIDEIIQYKTAYSIIICGLWLSLPFNEKNIILNNIYQYTQFQYGFNSLLDIPMIKSLQENSKKYNLYLKLLDAYLNKIKDDKEEYHLNLNIARNTINKHI